MTVVIRADCDACGAGGPEADVNARTADQMRAETRLVDGSEFGLADVHEACLEDLRRGVDPARVAGLPGLATP